VCSCSTFFDKHFIEKCYDRKKDDDDYDDDDTMMMMLIKV